jgi:tRNA nucleotidyltransferase (CCA-adding enzyme)
MMTSPVIAIKPTDTIKEAANTMTKYNINVLVVLNKQGNLAGYITRQVTEKATYFGLGHVQVKDYMNIEFHTVGPETPLHEVQDLIIRNRLRILPVIDNKRVVGVITRTDLMNILVGGPVIPDFYYETRHTRHFERKKNYANLLKERIPSHLYTILREFGEVADRLACNAYLVGGLVRDILLKHENLDVDVVVEGDGIEFAHEYAKNKEVRVRSHKKFGTAVLIFPDDFKIDVATARVEYYESPAAPPVVETSSLKMDLFRRDFTINTLAIRLNKKVFGTLIDHFGGQQDLKEKVIRVLHNLSFVEDPTRIIRAIRFEQRFGFNIGKLTLGLMKNAIRIDCFKNLSGRRLFLEMKLLLMEENPKQAIERMNEFNLLSIISPKLSFTQPLSDLLNEIERVITWFNLLYLEESFESWKIYWYGLTALLENQSLAQVAHNLQMTDLESLKMIRQAQDINNIFNRLHQIGPKDTYEIYTLLSQYDTEILLFLMAKTNNERIKRQISLYFTRLKGERINLKGRDLKKMGFKPGPLYKEILDNILKRPG